MAGSAWHLASAPQTAAVGLAAAVDALAVEAVSRLGIQPPGG